MRRCRWRIRHVRNGASRDSDMTLYYNINQINNDKKAEPGESGMFK